MVSKNNDKCHTKALECNIYLNILIFKDRDKDKNPYCLGL